MIRRFRTLSFSFLFALQLFWGCLNDPDRNNLLDPKSENFEDTGSISGNTFTFYSPFQSLDGVTLKLQPGGLVTSSNENGEFVFSGIPTRRYAISALKDGYGHNPDSVEVKIGQTTKTQLHLDGLPIISSVSIISCHLARAFPLEDLNILEFSARVDDFDGFNDISEVLLEIPELSFTDTLDITQTQGVYIKRINESELPINNLQDMFGRQIFIKARDLVGFITVSGPKLLARVIEETPLVDSPTGFTGLNDTTPELSWRLVDLPFNFSFRVDVLSIDFGVSLEVWNKPGISKDETSVSVEQVLAPGAYSWSVSVVDEFGNWSRSEEASFQIN